MNTPLHDRSSRRRAVFLPLLAMAISVRADAADPGAQAGEAGIVSGAEMVVTATRVPERVSDSLSAVRVITAADLEQSGQMSLVEILRQYGGVEVNSSGGLGQPSAVMIRGASGSHTLVLVDGLRLQSASTGSSALENIPVSQIARIEVVAGPMSSLYGSDAIGGVIQIFTRNARPEGGSELSVGLGSFQTGRVQLAHSARVGEVDYSVAAGYLGSEGFSATNPGAGYFYSQNRDPYRNRNLTSKLTWHYSPDHALGLSVFDSAGATHFVSGPGSEDVTDQHLSQYALSSDDTLAPGWQSGLRIGVSRDYSNSGSYGSVETVQRQVAWQNTLRVPGGSLVAGAEYLHDQLFSDLTLYTATERSNRAVYLAYSGDFGAHGARLSLRREDNSQFGSVTTGALAYAYRIDSLARVRASYGAGFHAPSFNFLYYPPYPETPPLLTYLSNPALRPERSRNREIGIDLDFDGQRVSFGAFENRITDLIQGSTNSSTYINLPLNLSSARIRGLEASYAGQIGASRIEARAALQDPVDQTTGLRLQQRASRFGSARLTHAWSGTEFAAEWQGSGARFGAAGEDPTSRLGGYGLVNLIAIRSLTPQWRSELRWNNVTAKHYALVPGYNTPTSNLFATLTWTQQ